ncbi:mRNA interferase MazF [Paenibacillus rhizosphaerae]|uniref:mRNA interferase n=1 Tax=Paenibacillus rhizosphaerae TaxID=297318 RepID=A0A839TYY8_9BACL|nr:mRNA interferase MazF [Paenibacillus rhizosphaerae]
MSRSIRVLRGQIWWANLGPGEGSEQAGDRPVLILQNDTGNDHAPTTIIAPITDGKKKYLPTHVCIRADRAITGVKKDSVVLLEQIRTIDKSRLIDRLGRMPVKGMEQVDRSIAISLGLIRDIKKAAQ